MPVSWHELSKHDKPGDLWIALHGKAYDVSKWALSHPGGQLVLVHSAGQDATRQFEAYHPKWVKSQLRSLLVGVMDPSGTPQHEVDVEFEKLKREVEEAGLMQSTLMDYAFLLPFVFALGAISTVLAMKGNLVAALVLALFWQQAAFLGHDLGHTACSQNRDINSALGLLVNAILGIGMSWWKSTHNVHHMVVNSADSDPDIQFMPLLAVSEFYFEPVWSKYHQDTLVFDELSRKLISWQHVTFIPLLMIAKFGLYLQTVKQLLHGKAYIHRMGEVIAQLIFFAWYAFFVSCYEGWERRLAFVLLSHAAFFVLHLQICLSHFACPVNKDLASSAGTWMELQVEGTMNWSGWPCFDFLMGGLQFQIEHHLFPRMPRQNLRAASVFVKASCKQCGLKYHCPTFWQAIVETIQVLHAAARKVRAMQSVSPRKISQRSDRKLVSRLFI